MWTEFSAPWGGTTMTRRVMLQHGLAGAMGALLAGKLAAADTPSPAPGSPSLAKTKPRKAKSVIQVWLWGGPSHLDTFDPKPDAGNDYTGPLNSPIETNVSGIRISESPRARRSSVVVMKFSAPISDAMQNTAMLHSQRSSPSPCPGPACGIADSGG